jgi:intracellular multiplication protein IcmO
MANHKTLHGVPDEQMIKAADRVRDIRPFVTKAVDWLRQPQNMIVTLLMLAATAFTCPGAAAWLLVPASVLFAWGIARPEAIPLKIPIQAGKTGVVDVNERNPGTGAPMPGRGIFLIGNDLRSAKEVWLTNSDCRQHFLVLGTTGAGKALADSSLVHTPLGWRRMGDVRVGGRVSTPDGRSAEVVGVFPQGELDICRVRFADGRVLDTCPEHLWEVHHQHWTGRYVPGLSGAGTARPRLMRTREIAQMLARNRGTFHIRLPQAVEKPAAAQPTDPYLLGAMLGDGGFTGKTQRFSSAGAETVAAAGDALPAPAGWNARTREGGHPLHNPDRTGAEGPGLSGPGHGQGFIPDAYRNGSVAQRWALVQGMMDTGGSCDARNPSLSYSTSSERLARDFQEVVWSLGGFAAIGVPGNGDGRAGQPSYRVNIRHPDPGMFFSLPRKRALAGCPSRRDDGLKLEITGVEMNVRREDATCILVDHPEHLFVAENYIVTHNTETLLGFAANALSWGSGFLFCDGKGDVSLFAKVYAMARRFGREDDLLVLNFMNGNSSSDEKSGRLRSNTMNPFAVGSSDSLVQMIVSLMDDVGGDGAMWKGRATAMLTGIMYALCWLRDQGMIELNVGEIRDHMNLKKIIELADEGLFPDLPRKIRHSIRSYLTSLPGYQEDKKEKQAQTTLDQHGYLEMQFTRIFGNLADVYGHIFATPYGEVDMYDVVLNRRLLVIMLPALEKSGDEIANLGKIVVAALKGMMGATLGNKLEGDWESIVDNRPTNSPSPFMVILDEVGYYTVEGMALMAAQARSLGFSMVYASQDLNAMKRLNEKEAQSIIANTNHSGSRLRRRRRSGAGGRRRSGAAWRCCPGDRDCPERAEPPVQVLAHLAVGKPLAEGGGAHIAFHRLQVARVRHGLAPVPPGREDSDQAVARRRGERLRHGGGSCSGGWQPTPAPITCL